MKAFSTLVFGLLFTLAFGQTAPDKYWVRFTDKANSPFSIDNPTQFLSEAAIERRNRFDIEVTEEDFPVNPEYINALLSLGEIELFHQSRWFNAVTIKTLDPDKILEIMALPFVAETRSVEVLKGYKPTHPLVQSEKNASFDTSDYGIAYRQIEMLNGHLLHAAGYRGEGLRIALLDAGYNAADEMDAFQKLRDDGRMNQVADYVWGGSTVTQGSNHGTVVLSTMAAHLDGEFLGTAPDADYYLFRTEDSGSEYVIEEDNWIAAIEHADRIGVDLVNSSLGYSEFDDTTQNYTPDDMNGQVARISRAATIAASKGILVVTSAGNKGTSEWRVITAPGDAEDVLTVGAVDSLRIHAPFSSYGPTADGRIKPDVVAQGRMAAIVGVDNEIARSNGTSFSSPIVCGLVACLWQAHADRSNFEIMRAVQQSAHLFSAPNDSMGYGIPDFWRAHLILRGLPGDLDAEAVVYPNPAQDQVYIEWVTEGSEITVPEWRMIDMNGKVVAVGQLNAVGNRALGNFGLPAGCHTGQYIIELTWGGQRAIQRLQVRKLQ